MKPSHRIACVVVTFNRYAELIKTIAAINNQGLAFEDIIIINNKSTDGTEENLPKLYPNVHMVNLQDNVASAGGFAKGMQIAHTMRYDWVWLFNDDSRPLPGTLESALPYLIEGEDTLGLFKISNLDDQGRAVLLYWTGTRKPRYVTKSNVPVQTDLITFDGCFISAKLMDNIGYCDPQYFMGTYEFDYCLKARDNGFKIMTLPNGMIEDGKLGSAKGTPPWRQYYNTRNHLWLAINRRSLSILKGWLWKEMKYTYGIIRFSKTRRLSLIFKYRAVRDAILNRRGKTYDPLDYKSA